MTEIRNDKHIQLLQRRRKEKRFETFIHILEFENLFPTLKCTIDLMHANSNTRSSSLLPLRCDTNLYLDSFIPRTSREIRIGK